MFTTASTRASQFFPILSQINLVHTSLLHFSKIHLNIILPSMPRSFQWPHIFRSPHQNPVFISPLSRACYIPPYHFILLTIFGEQYRTLRSSSCSLFHSPVTSSLLDPNIFLSPLISNTLSLCSSLHIKDQVSHPYKTRDKIIVETQLQSQSERLGE